MIQNFSAEVLFQFYVAFSPNESFWIYYHLS